MISRRTCDWLIGHCIEQIFQHVWLMYLITRTLWRTVRKPSWLLKLQIKVTQNKGNELQPPTSQIPKKEEGQETPKGLNPSGSVVKPATLHELFSNGCILLHLSPLKHILLKIYVHNTMTLCIIFKLNSLYNYE